MAFFKCKYYTFFITVNLNDSPSNPGQNYKKHIYNRNYFVMQW